MKKVLIILAVLIVIGCDTYKHKIVFSDDLCPPKSDYHKNKTLEELDAKEEIYSLLFFTSSYNEDKLVIRNTDSLFYDDIMNSNKSVGLAHIIRVSNKSNIEISDINDNYSFSLDSKQLKKYKFVYIKKDMFNKKKPYLITFSNILCGFR